MGDPWQAFMQMLMSTQRPLPDVNTMNNMARDSIRVGGMATTGGSALPYKDPNVLRSLGLEDSLGGLATHARDVNVMRSLGLDVGDIGPTIGSTATAAKDASTRAGMSLLKKLGIGTAGAAGIGGLGAYMNGSKGSTPTGGTSVEDNMPNVSNSSGAGQTGGLDLETLLRMFGGGGGGSGRYDTPADTMNAESNRLQAQTQARVGDATIAKYMADSLNQEAQTALDRGDRVLARQKFQDAQVWSQRHADAEDAQNGISQQNANTSLQNANTGAYNANVGAATGEYDSNVRGYAANTDRLNSGNSLINILGDLANKQGQLQLEINKTPKNAIAGLLLGRGQAPNGNGGYSPGNVLGFDPAQLTNLINAGMSAFQQSKQMPTFNLAQTLAGLHAAGQAAQTGLPQNQMLQPPTDQSGMRIAGNRVPNNSVPDNGVANYGSVLQRMINGGAPQMVIDQYKQAADSAGYSLPGGN